MHGSSNIKLANYYVQFGFAFIFSGSFQSSVGNSRITR